MPRFRAALAERFGGEPEHILVLAGAQQGLDLLARCLIDPGDAVIIDRPGYLGAIQTFRNAGARLVGWDITRADTDELEELLLRYRPKLIYTNPTHQNPTGVTLPIRTRRELLELAARYRVPIVEDDTYRELALTGRRRRRRSSSSTRRTTSSSASTASRRCSRRGCGSAGSAPSGRSSSSSR